MENTSSRRYKITKSYLTSRWSCPVFRYSWCPVLTFFISLLCDSPFVFAQSQDNNYEEYAFEDSIAYELLLEDYVVTGQYRPTHYKNALHDVNVLEGETLEKLGATQLDQALRLSPSIRINQDPVLGSQIQMRGISASNVAILMDGIPIIGRLDGAIDLSQISVQNVERIEIVEGPLSNIYGNNAAAGVINIITKKSQVNPISLEANSQYESIGQWNHYLNAGIRKGKWLVRGHGRYFRYRKYPSDSMRLVDRIELDNGTTINRPRYPWNPKIQVGAGASVRYSFNDDHQLSVKYDYNDEEVTDYGSVRRPTFKPYANDGSYSTKRNDLAVNYKGQINRFYADYSFGYNQYNRVTEEKRYYLESMTFDSLLQTSDKTTFDAYFSRLNLAFNVDEKLELMAGFHYDREDGSGDRILDHEREDSTDASYNEKAVFAEMRYLVIPDLRLGASARYTHHSTYGGQWTPGLHLKYDLNAEWSLRLGYANGYRSPSLKELYIEFIDVNHYIIGNPDLQPETSTDFQSTVNYTPSRNMQFGLNAYRTKIRDKISLVEYETLKYTYENISSYDVYGFQLSANVNFGQFKLSSGVGLGYWSTSIDNDDAPKYRRALDMNHNLAYDLPGINASIMCNYRYIGAQPSYFYEGEDIVTQTTSAINMLDISVQKSFLKNKLQLTTGIKNLLDIVSTEVTGEVGSGTTAHSTSLSRIISRGRNYFVQLGVRF